MKKTIAALALSASATSAYALRFPVEMDKKTICLNVSKTADKSLRAGSCDEANNNLSDELPLLQNGCAAGQVAIVTFAEKGTENFDVQVPMCWPRGVVQL